MPSTKGGSRHRWTKKKVQEQQQREQQEQEQRELEQQQQEERERQAQAQARDQEQAELQRQQQEQAQGAGQDGSRQEAGSAKPVVSRRLLVLLHGEKANDDLIREAICRVRKDGHKVAVRVTYEAGDVDRLVAEALKLGTADTLVAAGGDGTVNEVVAAILRHTGGLKDTRHSNIEQGQVSGHSNVDMGEYQQHQEAAPDGRVGSQYQREHALHAASSLEHMKRVTMAILPMGTSNDFAATTGIPQDPYEALSLATRPDCAKPIDVGLVNNRIFMNTATVGASADVGKLTSSAIKKVLGPAAFLLTGARTMVSWHPHTSTLRFPHVSDTSPPPLALSGSSADIAMEVGAHGSSGGGDADRREAHEATLEGAAAGSADAHGLEVGAHGSSGGGGGDANRREAHEATLEGAAAGSADGHRAAGIEAEASQDHGTVESAQDHRADPSAVHAGHELLCEMVSLEEHELKPASGGESPVFDEDKGANLKGKAEVGEGENGSRGGQQQQEEAARAKVAAGVGAVGQGGAREKAAAAGAAHADGYGLVSSSSVALEDLTEVGMGSTAAGSMVSEFGIDTARAKRFADRVSDGLRSTRSSYSGYTPRQSQPEAPSLAYLHLESKNGNLSRSGSIRSKSGKAVRVGGGWASAPPLPPPPIPTPRTPRTPRSASMRSSSMRSMRSGGSNLASRETAAAAAAAAIPPAGPEEVQHKDEGVQQSSSTEASNAAAQSAPQKGGMLGTDDAHQSSSSRDNAAPAACSGKEGEHQTSVAQDSQQQQQQQHAHDTGAVSAGGETEQAGQGREGEGAHELHPREFWKAQDSQVQQQQQQQQQPAPGEGGGGPGAGGATSGVGSGLGNSLHADAKPFVPSGFHTSAPPPPPQASQPLPLQQQQQQGERGAVSMASLEGGKPDHTANAAGDAFVRNQDPGGLVASPPSQSGDEAAANTQAAVTELQGVPLLHVTAANNRQIASMVAVSPNALLDDGLLDVIYLTGTPGQQVCRVLRDFVRKGWSGTRSVPCLLRVPWLEIETEEALEWSLDGEPAAHPSTSLRLSLLHRAILTHLPDDRMLMAGNESADAAVVAAPTESRGQGRRRRVLRSLKRPGPTLKELLGSVVVFKKKKDWRKMALGTLGNVARASVWVMLGGAAVHVWHSRRGRKSKAAEQQAAEEQGLAAKSLAGFGDSVRRATTIVQAAGF